MYLALHFDETTGIGQVSGTMNFSTIMAIDNVGKKLIDDKSQLILDFSQVTVGDSAGLALLIDWIRYAKKLKKRLLFKKLPKQLLAIAQVTGLNRLLPIESQ